MRHTLSVLDLTAEEVRTLIEQHLGGTFDILYATSYDRQEQISLAAKADFIWVGWPPVDAEMIAKAPKLKVIHKCGIGTDDIDLEAAQSKGIKVYRTSAVNAIPVSEMALLLMMAVLRHLVYADFNLRNKKWLKTELRGTAQHLTGKTIGIVGMGNIGKNLAKLLGGFDCNLFYYDVLRPPRHVEMSLGIKYKPFEELLQSCEILTLHAPLTSETTHMINARTLALMNKNTILINTSRGGLIDEKALIEALSTGSIAGAGLDVYETEPLDPNSPLLSMYNVTLSPHVAGSTLNNMSIRAMRIAKNLEAFINGGEIDKEDIVVDE